MVDKDDKQLAVIDIGSNSVRFVVYQVSGVAFTPVYNEKVLAGLGRDIRVTGRLNANGKALALDALKRFHLLIDGLAIQTVLIAATAALRVADDADEFIATIQAVANFNIKPLSGEEEAYYAALGVVAGEPRAHGLCVDLGGASLEFTPIKHGEPQAGHSFPLGPFAVYEDVFDPKQARRTICEKLALFEIPDPQETLYLVGGAWRNLALIEQSQNQYPLKVVQNYALNRDAAQTLAKWGYSPQGQDTLRTWPGLKTQRSDTLPYSCLMLEEILKRVPASSIVIAPGGLRDGLVFSTLSQNMAHKTALLDACRDLASGNREGGDFSEPLFQFLADAATAFPRTFNRDNENRLRNAACHLVSIGKGLHPDHKAKMVFRTVLYAPLPGLNHKERAYLALMLFASFSAKSSTPNQNAIDYLLDPQEQLSARIYGTSMRLGVTLTARSAPLLRRIKLIKHDTVLKLYIPEDQSALISQRIHFRLKQISDLLKCDTHITSSKH